MITPTVGRVVWYYEANIGPAAAIICKVHSDRLVNLMVIAENGTTFPAENVTLIQDDDWTRPNEYCEWMPYQKGQAAKTEALESQLKGAA
jgi:hypothetical protein